MSFASACRKWSERESTSGSRGLYGWSYAKHAKEYVRRTMNNGRCGTEDCVELQKRMGRRIPGGIRTHVYISLDIPDED